MTETNESIIQSLVGKRVLARVKQRAYWGQEVVELRILELSPSGNYVRLQNEHGAKFWKEVTELAVVEELVDLREKRRREGLSSGV